MTGTHHVRVEGTSYERGCQYGRQAAARIRLSVRAYQQIFAHFADWDWPTVRREAARFEAPIGKAMPAYLEELRGIADGAGLGLGTNALVTDTDVGEPGLPYHVLLRAVLDCTTVTDALQVLQAGPRSSSANYLIAHAGGAALDIEAAPGDFTRLYPVYPEDGVLRHTNHFLADIGPADLALWAMPSSAVRLQRLRAAGTTRTLDDFGVLLADHADYPHSVCAHPDPAAHPCEQGATIASVLMDLTARRIWLAAGNPCQAPFEQLDIAL